MPDPARPPRGNPAPYRPRVFLHHDVELDGVRYEVHPAGPERFKVYRVLERRRGRELRNVDRKTKEAVVHELKKRWRAEEAERQRQRQLADSVLGPASERAPVAERVADEGAA